MCPHEPAPETTNGADAEMVSVDLGAAVKTNDGPKHGEKKGFYSRPSDFLSNTSNWQVSSVAGGSSGGGRSEGCGSVTMVTGCGSPVQIPDCTDGHGQTLCCPFCIERPSGWWNAACPV